MAESYVKKNGLLYSQDLKTVYGIYSNIEFNGRIPFGAHEIAEDAFAGSDIQSVSIPDSVKELPPCLFENLTNLKTAKLPSYLNDLPPYLFSGCSSLEKVNMPEKFNGFSEGFFYGCKSLKEIPFKSGVQEIQEMAFAACTNLTSIVIPNSVVKIGPSAFADCSNLETIVFSAKLYELSEDAFAGCNKIRSIRIDPDNHLFYVNEEDGCLYEKSIDGEDKLRLKIVDKTGQKAELINENLDDSVTNPNNSDLTFISEDEIEEDDTFFAANEEIAATNEELTQFQEKTEQENKNNDNINKIGEKLNMTNNDVDAMFADIMGEEKERKEVTSEVGISDEESKVLSEMMDVMADSKPASSSAAISTEELENLFASHEAEATQNNTEVSEDKIDSKTQILIDSVSVSKIIECTPTGESPEDGDLFVIAEKTVEDAEGNKVFTEKLINCAQKIARIQDFKRIIMISGLPLDNDEFMQFYFHFINKRNVLLAVSATSPSQLSEECKTICEQSRISLDKNDLQNQRKSAGLKSNTLIKLIVQDIY